jgi:uncharacterized 2Fe-2S/4Fe-4S cluster protein (DUF4445 family)
LKKNEKVEINIFRANKIYTIYCEENESLMEAMLRQGHYISAVCGGKGSCGKCKVKVIDGIIDISISDKDIFTDEELKKGYRLSCRAFPKENCTIKLLAKDELDFEVITYKNDKHKTIGIKHETYVIGVDIGTTTFAVSLVGEDSQSIKKTYTAINKQRVYGADVITRMQASNDGKKEILRQSIQKDLLEGIQKVIMEAKISISDVKKIAIAGNTTMGHLLLGYSCEGLGVFPFEPVDISTIERTFREIFQSDYLDIPVVLLPGISTYVGGDIVAGLLVCNFSLTQKNCMLIDLGTNGEMAIGNTDKIWVSSTAAGPAFEGGNISQGVGSISGAICNVSIKEDQVSYKTIGNDKAIGICGTGVIEITSELIKEGLVNETGLLDEKYFDDGFVVARDKKEESIIFTQKDIREIQLAKSAVRAGMEILLLRSGLSYEQVDTVYLAGGFGYKMDIEKAIYIGLLPRAFADKIKAIGNSSLEGAIQYLTDKNSAERVEKILSISDEIQLSNDENFNDLYMKHMYFDQN